MAAGLKIRANQPVASPHDDRARHARHHRPPVHDAPRPFRAAPRPRCAGGADRLVLGGALGVRPRRPSRPAGVVAARREHQHRRPAAAQRGAPARALPAADGDLGRPDATLDPGPVRDGLEPRREDHGRGIRGVAGRRERPDRSRPAGRRGAPGLGRRSRRPGRAARGGRGRRAPGLGAPGGTLPAARAPRPRGPRGGRGGACRRGRSPGPERGRPRVRHRLQRADAAAPLRLPRGRVADLGDPPLPDHRRRRAGAGPRARLLGGAGRRARLQRPGAPDQGLHGDPGHHARRLRPRRARLAAPPAHHPRCFAAAGRRSLAT